MKNKLALCVAAFAAGSLSSVAQAENGGSSGFRISMTIPEVCQLETDNLVVEQDDGVAVANVFEMCNSGRGFRVIASHRPLENGEQVQLNYAGQVSQLDHSGTSEIAYRSGPTVGRVPVSVQTSGLVQNLAISFGMTAI